MSTPDHKALVAAITRLLRQVLEQRGRTAPSGAGAETILFGPGGALDSMGLVTLIMEVEYMLAEQFGVTLTLADDRAMSQRTSPFRSVGTLADYILHNLGDSDAH